MSSSSPSTSSDDSDEFFDAAENLNSSFLKRKPASAAKPPSITISSSSNQQSVRDLSEIIGASGTCPLEGTKNETKSKDALHDEIAKELEALGLKDDRKTRIDRLEKKRRGGASTEVPPTSEIDNDEDDVRQSHHGSAESSVEGIYISGSRPSHPFKVIEADTDRRSAGSDTTRSVHSKSTGRYSEASGIGPLPFSELVGEGRHLENAYLFGSSSSSSTSKSQIPDVVSSSQNETGAAAELPEDAMAPPKRPPRRKKPPTPAESRDPGTQPREQQGGTANTQATINTFFSLNILQSKLGRVAAAKISSTSKRVPDHPPPRNDQEPLFSELEMRPSSLNIPNTRLHEEADPLPSPASAVASLTRELESTLQTLDLQAAVRGQFVVKPQDDMKTRGESRVFIQEPQISSMSVNVQEEKPASSCDEVAVSDKPSVRDDACAGNRAFKSGSGSGGYRHHTVSPGGTYSLGSSTTTTSNTNTGSDRGSGGKRSCKSSGSIDSAAGLTKQMNMLFRTKTDSGKVLSDEDILKQIKVKNLDTGEEMDLVKAEDQLPQSINPLSLHIMRRTSEYVSGGLAHKVVDSDSESRVSSVSGYELGSGKKKPSGVKKFLGNAMKKTTDAAKYVAEAGKKKPMDSVVGKEKDVEKIGRLATEIKSSEGVPAPSRDGKGLIFKRIQAHKSGPFDFEGIQFAQELSSPHLGPIWCMRFSHCGQLLATAGKDMVLQIWVLKSAYHYFKDKRNRYTSDHAKMSPTNSYEDVISDQMASEDKSYQVFMDTPFASYQGHTSDLLDVSWSKNYFILTSSMDKTVRLWHISRKECLCCFQHIDFVTAISFHPRNDQFFLSGSLDGKLRLWNIPEKKVALWNEVDGNSTLITAANFIQNGKFAVVGTYDGRCIFYTTDQLKYYTMIHVRSARGKNSEGRKVTGIEPMPGEDKILITSNDSRIRLYDLRDLSLSCKYKGYSNNSSQIRASFSHDGKYITAGSENHCVYLWRTNTDSNNLTVRKDRNSHYEAIKAHNAAVTCSVFAPNPDLIIEQLQNQQSSAADSFSSPSSSPPPCLAGSFDRSKSCSSASGNKKEQHSGYIVISGDYDGGMNVFVNVLKPKHSSLPSPLPKGS